MKKNLNKVFYILSALIFFTGPVFSQKLYFCEEYKDGKEIGVSKTFTITPDGGYITCMIDLSDIGKTISTDRVSLVVVDRSYGGYKVIDTLGFDVLSDWDYIFFDQFYTFYNEGYYQVTAITPEGEKIVSGNVTIKMQ